jgi:hypothetical protein
MDPTPGASNTPSSTFDPATNIKATIQPNPFREQFVFSFEDQMHRTVRWKFTDVLGKEVNRSTTWLKANSFVVKTGNQQPGIYFLIVETEAGEVIVKKVVAAK